MKKLFLFMSWVMLILSGCADEDIIERNSPSFPQSVNTRSAGDGVYDILGYGYDITGPYLDTKSSRAIVFDTNKLLEKGLITPYKLEESRFRYSSGKDVIDFTTNMSSSLQMSTPGILKVIGGASLNIAFGGNSHYNSDYSFAYCTQQYIDSRYRISEADINVLKTCLTKQFIERLSTYTPEQIVEEYGTHVLKDIYLGAKFEVYYMAKSTSSSKKESINAGLGASLFSLFKMDGKFQYDESLAITNKEQSLYYFTIGGDPAVGVQGSLNPENSPSIDIGKWMASVKSSTPKFIDVDNNSQSFIPIYELVTEIALTQAKRKDPISKGDTPISRSIIQTANAYLYNNTVCVDFNEVLPNVTITLINESTSKLIHSEAYNEPTNIDITLDEGYSSGNYLIKIESDEVLLYGYFSL